jgi:phosphoenolpyruvate synthase/pyruvate phosphate dikinase
MEKMRYIITLNNVKQSDLGSVGFRAVDLTVLREKGLNIPLSFVINNQAFIEFVEENNLKSKVEKALRDYEPEEAYKEILKLFSKASLSKSFTDELNEAYDSLTIDTGASASAILSKWDFPFANVMRSPSYLLGTEDKEGILQNIKGIEILHGAIKLVWASIYSPDSIHYRQSKGIKEPFGIGLIIQKMKKIKQSAEAYSYSEHDDKTIVVKSFLGMQDFSFENEILGKDYHEVSMNSLLITRAEVNVQEYCVERDIDKEELVLHDLRGEGSRQKLDDKQIAEIARLTKRAKSFLGKDIKLYFEIKDDFKYVVLACQRMGGIRRVAEETEEAVVQIAQGREKVVEHKRELIVEGAEEEPFELPKILDSEEAKAKVLVEEPFLAEELGQKPAEDNETEEVYVPLEEKAPEEEVAEAKVKKEVNLLEEVLKIKEVIERMEEHALNNNHESYNLESKRLKEMMSRVRDEG